MATNRVFKDGEYLAVPASALTGVNDPIESGDPLLFGAANVPCVATSDEDADGNVSVQFGGVYDLAVKGADGAGNAAVAVGDAVYYDAGATPDELNADDTNGALFGYALEAVSSGATTTIRVKLARA